MRITDSYIMSNYLRTLNNNKQRLERLQKDLSTLNRIHNLSDSPESIGRILRYKDYLSQTELYSRNIQSGTAFLSTSVESMEMMDAELVKVLTVIAESGNPANQNPDLFADRIDAALQNMLAQANRSFEGKYLFGGTDFSRQPFQTSEGSSVISFDPFTISGSQKIKIGNNLLQQINVAGGDLFGSIMKVTGSFDENAPAGSVVQSQNTVFNAAGQEFTLNAAYTRTSNNTYMLTYDITDSEGNSVFTSPPQAKQLVFNNGKLQSIDGGNPVPFEITNESSRIKFSIDLSGLNESGTPGSLGYSLNRKADIFNILSTLRDNFRAGQQPTAEQRSMIENFRKDLLNRIASAGNNLNIMSSAEESLIEQRTHLQKFLSDETDVDVAKTVMQLQNQDYIMQLSYKISAMILPKTLMDFL